MGEPKYEQNLQDVVSIRVNHLRFINGMQQKELAFRLGISPSTLNAKIKGHGKWGLEDSLELCKIFEVTIDYLTGQTPLEGAMPAIKNTSGAEATEVNEWARRGSNPRPAD